MGTLGAVSGALFHAVAHDSEAGGDSRDGQVRGLGVAGGAKDGSVIGRSVGVQLRSELATFARCGRAADVAAKSSSAER